MFSSTLSASRVLKDLISKTKAVVLYLIICLFLIFCIDAGAVFAACDCAAIPSVDAVWTDLESIIGSEAATHFDNHNHESVYSLISNDPQIMINANPCGAVHDENGDLAITHLLDNEWFDRVNNTVESPFNTVYDCDPSASGIDSESNPGGVFEVVSVVDQYGPSASRNPNEYYFSYDALNDGVGAAITIKQWVDYLKQIKEQYGRIGRLTIFCHGDHNKIKMSDNFILHYNNLSIPDCNDNPTACNNILNDAHSRSQLSRLKTEQILADKADILLLVCRVAGSVQGVHLVQEIALLTGATVHANTNFTGDDWPGYDSDWSLDVVRCPDITLQRLGETSIYAENPDSAYHDNYWENPNEALDDVSSAYVTHVLYPYPEYKLESGDLSFGTPGLNNYGQQSSENLIPIILIHGLQSDNGLTHPAKLIEYANSAENYWQRFLEYFEKTPKLNQTYRIFLYKYPSYKHITYNARKLKELINDLSYFKNHKPILLAHSMGGLVARSLIEEHGFQNVWALITLATPHHGSPASMKNWVDSGHLWEFLYVDLETPGAQDLFWDNYDGIIEWAQLDMAVTGEGRMEELESFDHSYRIKCIQDELVPIVSQVNPLIEQTYYEGKIHRFPNPWLTWLNEKLRGNAPAIPYILYAGYNETFEESENNYLLDTLKPKATTSILYDKGYVNDCLVPVTSGFLDCTKHDQFIPINTNNSSLFEEIYPGQYKVALYSDELISSNIKFIYYADEVTPNYSIRFFKDYNHERMRDDVDKSDFQDYVEGDDYSNYWVWYCNASPLKKEDGLATIYPLFDTIQYDLNHLADSIPWHPGNIYGIDTTQSAYTSQNAFYVTYGGQSTSFAWGRALDRLGVEITFNASSGSIAKNWPDMVTNNDITFESTPRSNSIAVWGGESEDAGHVAYVEEVDGDYVYINEANVLTHQDTDFGGGYDGFCKYSLISELSNRGTEIGELQGYLYLPSPFSDYYYWDFDTQGTEDWNVRNALTQGIYNSNYWQIDLCYDSASKSGIISPPLNLIHTDQYDMIEVRAAHKTKFLDHIEAYFKISDVWRGPVTINYVSGAQQANSQCIYRGNIGYAGQIQQARIDFDEGSDSTEIDDRVYITDFRSSFLINTGHYSEKKQNPGDRKIYHFTSFLLLL